MNHGIGASKSPKQLFQVRARSVVPGVSEFGREVVEGAAMSIVSTQTGKHYVWGANCDGRHLAVSPNLSVIQERMPIGCAEIRHLYHKAERFFYVLGGTATRAVAGAVYVVRSNEGRHVPAGVPQTLSDKHEQILDFLVMSSPPSHEERENI